MLFQPPPVEASGREAPEDRHDLLEVLTAAITGSDAYATVKRAVRWEEGTLRIGNGFVRRSKVREVAFLAVGHCAAAMARGFHDALGEVVTQGLVAGPEPPPDPWPFLFREIPDARAPSEVTAALAADAVELAQGLGKRDLFVPLLSPGALGMLSAPPPTVPLSDWTRIWTQLEEAPTARRDLPAVAAGLGLAQGGRLVEATQARVEALLVTRGEGGEFLGGGPTVPPSPATRERARRALETLGAWDRLPAAARQRVEGPGPSLAPGRVHTVVITSPADALETAGAEAANRRHRARLVELHDDSPPEAAADRLLAALEEKAAWRKPDHGDGLALFSGLSLNVPEAEERSDLLARFLLRAQEGIHRRGVTVAVLSTGGSLRDDLSPSGGFVDARSHFRPSDFVRGGPGALDLLAGFTDVGPIAVAFWTPTPGAPIRSERSGTDVTPSARSAP